MTDAADLEARVAELERRLDALGAAVRGHRASLDPLRSPLAIHHELSDAMLTAIELCEPERTAVVSRAAA